MPIMDGLLYGRLSFSNSSNGCPHPNSSTQLIGRTLTSTTPFCANSGPPMAPGPPPHITLMPTLLFSQSRDSCIDVSLPPPPPPPPLGNYLNNSTLPYHHIPINSAPLPHSASPLFSQNIHPSAHTLSASCPTSYGHHFSLGYPDLINDVSRRPSLEKNSFTNVPHARDANARYSNHLQLLRDSPIPQAKCNGPCCALISPRVNHNSCNCCNSISNIHSSLKCLSSSHSNKTMCPTKVNGSITPVASSLPVSNYTINGKGQPSSTFHSNMCNTDLNGNNNNNNNNNYYTIDRNSNQVQNSSHQLNSIHDQINKTDNWKCVNGSYNQPSCLTKNGFIKIDNDLNLGKGKSEAELITKVKQEIVTQQQPVEFISLSPSRSLTKSSDLNERDTISKAKCETIKSESNQSSNGSAVCEPKQIKSMIKAGTGLAQSMNLKLPSAENDDKVDAKNRILISEPTDVNLNYDLKVSSKLSEKVNHLTNRKSSLPPSSINNIETLNISSSSIATTTTATKLSSSAFSSTSSSKQTSFSSANVASLELNLFGKHKDKIETENSLEEKSVIKQLKDYKIQTKLISTNKVPEDAKRQQLMKKETKTIEIQCNGPDWTPIVLPTQFKKKISNKGIKSQNKKSGTFCKNRKLKRSSKNNLNKVTWIESDESKDVRLSSQSPSTSTSTSSTFCDSKIAHNKSRIDNLPSGSEGRPHKRSMVDSLAEIEGYSADKVKAKREKLSSSLPANKVEKLVQNHNLSKHISSFKVDFNCSSKKSSKKSPSTDAKASLSSLRSSSKSQIKSSSSSSVSFDLTPKVTSVNKRTSRKSSQSLNESIKSNENDDNDRLESSLDKSKSPEKATKRKLRERLFQRMEETTVTDQTVIEAEKKKMTVKKRKLDDVSLTNESSVKKAPSTVRRRRFRSGLDMIRTPNRRKKAKLAQIKNGTYDSNKAKQTPDSKISGVEKNSGSASGIPSEMKRIMVNKALGETALHRAARQGYKDVVMHCLSTKSCDINTRDNAGYTPLHECAARGHLEIVRALLEHGADVEASAAGGIRPLHDAVESDEVEVVRLLISYGSDPTIATYSGLTCLKLARSKMMLEFLRGCIFDLTGEIPSDLDKPVLAWKFMGSSSFMDPTESGYNIFDENTIPSDDGQTEEFDDFLFEVSEVPHLPTFRLPLSASKTKVLYNYLRLSDILKQTGLSKEHFLARNKNIEITCLSNLQFESNLLISSKCKFKYELQNHSGTAVEMVKVDDQIRDILQIESIRVR